MLVPVRLCGQNFDFLVDTGAAYTAINPRLASLFNLLASDLRRMTIAPVHGSPLSVPQVVLPELRTGGIELTEVDALVVSFPSELRLHGIIGMNVLRQFRVTLEGDTNTLVLRMI
ncbi:MAG: hypothetical protein ETSY2_11815 [Candidatus Entotheonella gemina]|uniref:Peptidase A2 domain-containing protein n=1 Tax=Candidatus Entotheonella gemina TaxID=1429439 RepID=W4MAW4_9BACT|nr:MAG: hypothetical protein ETSY2_11815 [Candidatus Entotheonella gemina]